MILFTLFDISGQWQFVSGVVDNLTPVANLPPVMLTSGGEFANGVVDTGGVPSLANISKGL